MLQDGTQWHFDYPRLACDAGFTFDRRKNQNIDKTKISQIDVDRIIQERDVATVERCIPTIIQFILDSDQAELLDSRFVNTFRISQLSLEYLLFCKKYLDNTVVILKQELNKFKQENKELKEFVEELKDHIALLMRKAKEPQNVYKCEECNKIFSTDEFLKAHKLRRHGAGMSTPQEPESSKLQLEIKELKGRLNTAEKLLQDQNRPIHTEENTASKSDDKFEELQDNFQKFKNQVEVELKQLEKQQNFEQKCEKWFGLALQNMRVGNVEANTEVKKTAEIQVEVRERRESTTQTESLIQEKEIIEITKSPSETSQIREFQEVMESKMTSTLQKIETQMDTFRDTLNQLEIAKISTSSDKENEEVVQKPNSPPKIKPRTKYTTTNSFSKEVKLSPARRITVAESPKHSKINKMEPSQGNDLQVIKPKEMAHKSSSDSDGISINSSSESESEKSSEIMPPPAKTIVPKRTQTTVRNIPKLNKKSPEKLQNPNVSKIKIEKELMERLQDLGISPDWEGLPFRTFNRASEIVDHQANLMKKTYPDFFKISGRIDNEVSQLLKENEVKNTRKTSKRKKIQPIKKPVQEFKKADRRGTQVEIKNRKMYETDSESESIKAPEPEVRAPAPYSAVIQELKNLTLAKLDSELLSSDLESLHQDGKLQDDQTKGVLKNYASVGSLTKKKVLFNLDETGDGLDKSNRVNQIITAKDGGSTTSVGSSELDGTPRNNKSSNRKYEAEKEIEDLSDFDFSEI